MRPIFQSALTVLAVLVLLALFFAYRYARIEGAFETITPTGACRVIAKGLAGPQDLEIDAAHGGVFVAAASGLYWLALDNPAAAPTKLTGTAAGLHPHGISLYRLNDGGESLMAIDTKPGDAGAVEIYGLAFGAGAPKLTQQLFMRARLLNGSGDIAATSPSAFYVTNRYGSTGAFGRFLEDYLLWPHSDLAVSNGVGLRIAVQRLALAAGVAVSADGRFVYVTAAGDGRVVAFSREEFTGNLTEIGALALPARPADISLDAEGDLIVAGSTKADSAQVFRVHLGKDGVPQSYDTLFSDDGHQLRGASSAALWKGHLVVGSSRDDHMLDCDVK